jgi:hypothetical protein
VVRREQPQESSGEGGGSAGGGGGGGNTKNFSIKGPDRVLRSQIVNALGQSPEDVKKLFLSWVESEGSK